MRGRTIGLVVSLALGLLAAPLLADAQQAGKIYRIGYLTYVASPSMRDEAFLQSLRDLGWIEGQNIAIEYRWAARKFDRLPALAEELVGLKVDLIVVTARPVTQAVKDATSTIPIVMAATGDAVENGIITSLAHPGGNVTGVSAQNAATHTKLLEVLHETLPQVTQVAVLWNPKSPTYTRAFKAIQSMGPTIGLTIQSIEFDHYQKAELRPETFENALETAVHNRAEALVVMSGVHNTYGPEIAAFAAKNKMPVFSMSAIAIKKHFGLLAYGPDYFDMYRRAATYVDKILRGAKPEDLPVQRPQKFNLTVNLTMAKALGITIPPTVLYQATRIIR